MERISMENCCYTGKNAGYSPETTCVLQTKNTFFVKYRPASAGGRLFYSDGNFSGFGICFDRNDCLAGFLAGDDALGTYGSDLFI